MISEEGDIHAPAGTFRKLSAYEGVNALGNSRTRRRVTSIIAGSAEAVDPGD